MVFVKEEPGWPLLSTNIDKMIMLISRQPGIAPMPKWIDIQALKADENTLVVQSCPLIAVAQLVNSVVVSNEDQDRGEGN